VAEATALVVKVFSGVISDARRRKRSCWYGIAH
jgi:hypothetical protein